MSGSCGRLDAACAVCIARTQGLCFGTLLLRTGNVVLLGFPPSLPPSSHSSSLLTCAGQVDLGGAISLMLPQTRSICRLIASSHHPGAACTHRLQSSCHKQLSFPSRVSSAFGLRRAAGAAVCRWLYPFCSARSREASPRLSAPISGCKPAFLVLVLSGTAEPHQGIQKPRVPWVRWSVLADSACGCRGHW